MPTYISSMFRILEENNIPYSNDLIKIITPLGVIGTADYYIHTLGVPKTREEIIQSMKSYMADAYFHTIPAKEHVLSVLRELKRRGACLNVLTASPHITLDACLKRLGMYDLFDHVWSCDDFQTTKANPEIYVMAASRLNRPVESVLFLDDNLIADKTAKAAGMRVCGVYDALSAEYADEIKAVADGYIHDFSELLTFPEV